MFTLLRNYIREQKNSWLQVFGLGFLIIIMITTFLSLNFATTFLTNQYINDIAHNEFHQDIFFNTSTTDINNTQLAKPFTWNQDDGFLENMDYYTTAKNGKILISEKTFKNATFQLVHGPEYEEGLKNNQYYYRLIINSDNAIANTENLAIGKTFANNTGHNYIDFKLSLPFNYPSIKEHDNTLKDFAAMMDGYVYDPLNSATNKNRVNFFISSKQALNKYKEMVAKGEIPYATRSSYSQQDIVNESKIYQQLIIGMLYGDNVSWRRMATMSDILMTGKTINFIQTTPHDIVGKPILVKDGGTSLSLQPLKDNEILIFKAFADANNLKIGDSYIFSGHKLIIRGFATSTIVANKKNYFPKLDDKNQTCGFVNQSTFQEISSDPYAKLFSSDFIVYNPDIGSQHIGPNIDNYWLFKYFHDSIETKIKNATSDKYKNLQLLNNSIDAERFMQPLSYNLNSYNTIFESVALNSMETMKSIFQKISSVFLTLIFMVTTVIVFIIIFKMIDRNKQLIGILKANGYQSWKLNLALVLSIIIPLFFFSVMGAIISIFVSRFILIGFTSIFALVTTSFSFYIVPTITVITIPFFGLVIISFLLVAYLLRTPPLTLIKNSWAKKKYNINIGFIFKILTSFLIKKFNYRNKLVITNTFRSLGKLSLVVIVSFFASTLVLFSFASNGLIGNMLGKQFASINYKYGTQYSFDNTGDEVFKQHFINANNQLLYKKESVSDIKSQPSLYNPIRQAITDWIANPNSHPVVNFRYGYVMGSELLKIRREVIEPALLNGTMPPSFVNFWNKNIYFINYLTNNNGQNKVDLMINFGLMPYNNKFENPYATFNFDDAANFDVNNFDSSIYYDNKTNELVGDWDKKWGQNRVVYAVNEDTGNYLKPGFKVTNFDTFSNLNLKNMETSSWWQDQNFINLRNKIIDKLGIKNPATAAVQIVPMVGSTTPAVKAEADGGDGNDLDKTVIYRYKSLDNQDKYIIGVVYDGAKNLLANTILMPEKWIEQIILGNKVSAKNFANAKFSNLNNNELQNYLPILSSMNDYQIDISQIGNSNYLNAHGITPGVKMLYDVEAIKELVKAQQYTFQVLLTFFGIFLVLLTLLIVIIISNINIRDNLILINILRSLGYSFSEISYIFLVVTMPLLVIFSVFAIYIAPLIAGVLAGYLTQYAGILFPLIFHWWYYGLSFITVILIYIISYLITWKLNVSHKHLVKLTK